MSRPRRSKADTVAMILAAAAALFEEVGYFAVTLRGVAVRAGLSWHGVRSYFPDVDALWREAMGCAPPDGRLAQNLALALAGARAVPSAPVA